MKNNFVMHVVIGVVFLSGVSSAFAAAPDSSLNEASGKVNWNKAVKNYIRALRFDNSGVRQSAEQWLYAYKEETVEPLIAVLNDATEPEEVRKIAGRLLVDIGDARGIKAVEEASAHESSKEIVKFFQSLLE